MLFSFSRGIKRLVVLVVLVSVPASAEHEPIPDDGMLDLDFQVSDVTADSVTFSWHPPPYIYVFPSGAPSTETCTRPSALRNPPAARFLNYALRYVDTTTTRTLGISAIANLDREEDSYIWMYPGGLYELRGRTIRFEFRVWYQDCFVSRTLGKETGSFSFPPAGVDSASIRLMQNGEFILEWEPPIGCTTEMPCTYKIEKGSVSP